MEQPARYFPEQRRGELTRCSTRCAKPRSTRSVFSSTCAVYGTPSKPADGRVSFARTRAPVRREQAHGRADARLVRRVPRPPVGEPPLLQRAERVGRRSHRRGLDLHAQPRSAGDEGGARSHPGDQRCSAPTTTPPTAPASATTCTSRTSPTPTCGRSSTSRPARGPRRSTSGPARVLSSRGHRRGPRASGVDIPVKDTDRRPGDPVAIYGDNQRAARPARGGPTATSRRSSRAPGSGTRPTPTGYAADPEGPGTAAPAGPSFSLISMRGLQATRRPARLAW